MRKLVSIVCALAMLAGCSRDSGNGPASADSAAIPATADSTASKTSAMAAASRHEPVSADLQAHLVRPGSPLLGHLTAPVTLVEFLDPACEACRAFAPVVKQVQFLYPDEVRVVVRFAAFHRGSEDAIRLLLAAQQQKRFAEVLAALFEHQDEWASHHAPDIEAAWTIARAAGLDVKAARQYAVSAEVTERLRQEDEDLTALKVASTPTFYVNGKLLEDFGAQQLMDLVKAEVGAAGAH